MRPNAEGEEVKSTVLAEAKRMAMCYAEYCITMPDMFEYVLHQWKNEELGSLEGGDV